MPSYPTTAERIDVARARKVDAMRQVEAHAQALARRAAA